VVIHLLRHGETEGGPRYLGGTDVALSACGWQQMRTAVAGRSWDAIVSSPLRRCAEFAQALARELGVACRLEPELREMSFGAWEGRSASELMQIDAERLRLFWSNPGIHAPPGGETIPGLQARVMAAWRRLVTASNGERVLVVTHSGPIRVLRAAQSATALSALLSIEVPYASLLGMECRPDGSFLTPADALPSRPRAERG
jgi:alpha-ribazole phosphatase